MAGTGCSFHGSTSANHTVSTFLSARWRGIIWSRLLFARRAKGSQERLMTLTSLFPLSWAATISLFLYSNTCLTHASIFCSPHPRLVFESSLKKYTWFPISLHNSFLFIASLWFTLSLLIVQLESPLPLFVSSSYLHIPTFLHASRSYICNHLPPGPWHIIFHLKWLL